MSYRWAVRRPCLLALLRFALLLVAALPARAQAPIPAPIPAPIQAPTRVAYVAGMEDVPLMAGLAPTRTNDVTFDSPLGRIVIVHAQGAVERPRVLEFYATSLTELGWDRIGDSAFRREGELLRLELGQRAEFLTVRFTLSPVR